MSTSAPKPPKPPDPSKEAAAQTATNIGTAVASQAGSLINQQTPLGNLTYEQTGTHIYTDPLENVEHAIPTYTAVTTLTPQGERIQDLELDTTERVAGLANTGAQQAQGLFADPFRAERDNRPFERLAQDRLDVSPNATSAYLFDLGSQRLLPELDRQRRQTDTGLVNRGIRPGSYAYDDAMRRQGERENDMLIQLALSGHGQAVGDLATETQFNNTAAMNETNANNQLAMLEVDRANQQKAADRQTQMAELGTFAGLGSPAYPTALFTPGAGFSPATTDYAGLSQAAYGQEMNAYNQQLAAQQSGLGGLFSLGGALGGGLIGLL